jgi:hypothetical protein
MLFAAADGRLCTLKKSVKEVGNEVRAVPFITCIREDALTEPCKNSAKCWNEATASGVYKT